MFIFRVTMQDVKEPPEILLLRPKIGLFPLTCRKKLGSVGRKIFLFFFKFLLNKIRSKMFLWVTFH